MAKELLPGLPLGGDCIWRAGTGQKLTLPSTLLGKIANFDSCKHIRHLSKSYLPGLQWQSESWHLKNRAREKLAMEFSLGIQSPAKRKARCLFTVYQLTGYSSYYPVKIF